MIDIRVVICGDEKVGKSSLITTFVEAAFVPNTQKIIPVINVSPDALSTQQVNTIFVDTSSDPEEREALTCEIRKANVICLVYADNYSCERVSLFWLPFFRSCGVNVPIVLCANKFDLYNSAQEKIQDELIPIMEEFKEIEACLCCSAKLNFNINELFYLCKKCITHPLLPLYDTKEQTLKPLAYKALERIFLLSDRNQDGVLDDDELSQLQRECFSKDLPKSELADIKEAVFKLDPNFVSEKGLKLDGFLALNKLFLEKGRQETCWQILRAFHYTDSLDLNKIYLHPKLEIGPESRIELSEIGFEFLVDLFDRYDQDNDGALSKKELDSLFRLTPGVPNLWLDTGFPSCTATNEAGYITYDGWLAVWSMLAMLDYRITLEYFTYLGFVPANKNGTTDVLKVIKTPKSSKRLRFNKERNATLVYVIGSKNSGKTSLLQSFCGSQQYTKQNVVCRMVVNSVENADRMRYLVLLEIHTNDKIDFAPCDAVCCLYNSSDPDSFTYLAKIFEENPGIKTLPIVFAATKADLDRQPQRYHIQPDIYARELGLNPPIHISAKWDTNANFFALLSEAGQHNAKHLNKREKEFPNLKLVAAVCSVSTIILAISSHLLIRMYFVMKK